MGSSKKANSGMTGGEKPASIARSSTSTATAPKMMAVEVRLDRGSFLPPRAISRLASNAKGDSQRNKDGAHAHVGAQIRGGAEDDQEGKDQNGDTAVRCRPAVEAAHGFPSDGESGKNQGVADDARDAAGRNRTEHPQQQGAQATDTRRDGPFLQGDLLGIPAPEEDGRARSNEQHRDVDEEKRLNVDLHTPSQYRAAAGPDSP